MPFDTAKIKPLVTDLLGPDGKLMGGLLILAILGIGITDVSPTRSYGYWIVMVPVFGGACAWMGRDRGRRDGQSRWSFLQVELFYWLSVLAAIQVVYFLFRSGRIDGENTGLILLLILALSVFQAGFRLGWRLCALGLLLAVALLLATYLKTFIWVVLLFVAAAVAIFGVLGTKQIREKPAPGEGPASGETGDTPPEEGEGRV
jgi:hypothetical protein